MKKFILTLCIFLGSLNADFDLPAEAKLTKSETRELLSYSLPDSHPLKTALDVIFSQGRPSLDEATLAEAGFQTLYSQERSLIKVVRHASLPGYLIKLQLDTELRQKEGLPEWKWFLRRCQGVEKIHMAIALNRVKYFKAPRKWIYFLPNKELVPNSTIYSPKDTVLVVEDMNLVPKPENLLAWQTQLTKKHLDELYMIMSKAGGSSYRPRNIWLSTDGKFAFVDTEYPHLKPSYNSVRKSLTPDLQAYWDKICKKGAKNNLPIPF